ncbi:MAG: ABC transporter ATP-binding protein [Firmicutes bacterium]|nr:ABC transporter ATP-binding protein [Bacillota bacterium]
MNVLEIKDLNKAYPSFQLKDINMTLEKGYIMGFIGENGAGKTTTLRSMLNITAKDSGSVHIFEKDMNKHEIDIKQDIAFMSGDSMFFPRSRLYKITNIYKKFFKNWNDEIYNNYMSIFGLDQNKKVFELSQGMKMKYSLALALSHQAKFIILDEPTSGLDPVARDLLLEIFQSIVEDGEISILFSTHITSDLEKCADYITFIQNGKIIESSSKDDLLDHYRLIVGANELLPKYKDILIAHKKNSFGFTGLIHTEDASKLTDVELLPPTLDDIMIYFSMNGGRK